jgi:hypothetical protein
VLSSASRTLATWLRSVAHLEGLGYRVKGEVCGCDLVAIRADELPIVDIGELKLSFSLW